MHRNCLGRSEGPSDQRGSSGAYPAIPLDMLWIGDPIDPDDRTPDDCEVSRSSCPFVTSFRREVS